MGTDNMSPATILGFISIAVQLYKTIDDAVKASDNAELDAAWIEAQDSFNTALNDLK